MKLRGFGWLSVLTSLVKELVSPSAPTFPPVPYCVICTRTNHWIVPGKEYGCAAGHHFYTEGNVPDNFQRPLPPPPHDGGVI
jgi:hypothetical protein